METVKPRSQVPVAIFLTSFHPGGTERQMVELARRLDPSRFTVHMACLRREGAWLSRAAERAASIAEFSIGGLATPGALAAARRFARWCRLHGILVLQTCDLYANILGLLAGAWARVPVRIGSRREINPDKSAGQIRLQRLAYAAAHAVVANSAAAADALGKEGVPTERIEVIRNGLDVSAFTPQPRRGAACTIVTLANLRSEKRHELLFAAMRIVAVRHPGARLRVVGDGPRRRELEQLVADWGLAGRIEFLGHQTDVASALAAADIFALASRSEASPNALIEAMAAGLPAVATAAGGVPEILADGETGLLVPVDDASALARALLRLMDEPSLADRMGEAARRRAVDRYSFDRMTQAFERLYLSRLEACADASRRFPLPVC
jgi:L-malate glycosyltransferase